jgi:hypothetical protein
MDEAIVLASIMMLGGVCSIGLIGILNVFRTKKKKDL